MHTTFVCTNSKPIASTKAEIYRTTRLFRKELEMRRCHCFSEGERAPSKANSSSTRSTIQNELYGGRNSQFGNLPSSRSCLYRGYFLVIMKQSCRYQHVLLDGVSNVTSQNYHWTKKKIRTPRSVNQVVSPPTNLFSVGKLQHYTRRHTGYRNGYISGQPTTEPKEDRRFKKSRASDPWVISHSFCRPKNARTNKNPRKYPC